MPEPGFYLSLILRINVNGMKKKMNILLLEDNADDAEIIQRIILKAGIDCSFFLAMNKGSFLQAIEAFSPDVILSDNSLPQFNSEEALKITRSKYPHVPFILVTGTVSEEYAVKITKSGADDYILKDRLARLPVAIDTALHYRQSELEKKLAIQNLIESEQKYRALVSRITDAFIALDENWKYTYLNTHAGEMFHKNPQKLIGKNIWEIFPDTIESPTFHAFHKAMKEQQYICNQDYYPSLNLWLENHIYPSAGGLSVFIRDISETKKAEEEIKKANERFEMVVTATNDVVWDWDIITDSLWWNQHYYTHFGYAKNSKRPDISSRQEGIHPEDRERVRKGIWLSIGNHQPVWTDEYRFLKSDGTVCFILDYGCILYDDHEKPYRMVGAMLDISDRKLAEEQIKESFSEKKALAERMSAILNTLPANIVLLDSSGFIIDINEAWKKFALENGYNKTGYGIGENYITISGQSFGYEQRDGVQCANGIKAVLDNQLKEFVFEYPCHTPTLKRWFRMVVTPLREKTYSGAVVMHIDISELRKMAQDRIESKIEEQKKITKAILSAQEKERNLIGAELHDNVNQILAGIKLLLSTVHNYPQKSEEIINISMSNLQNAIEENRKIAHELVAPDFGDIFLTEQLRNLSEGMLKKAAIEVSIETGGLEEGLLDDDQKLAIYRIAQEQCTNILKYAGANSVTISLSTTEGIFRMSIADDGIGMETGKHSKGIGFRNIRSRLSLFNGHAHIDTVPGKGFVLEIQFPLNK
jgi:PAS domain S-box-containing protein